MKILETEQGWAMEHGDKFLKVDGESFFTDRSVLATAVEKRGLFVWSDGRVEKTPEPKKTKKTVSRETVPPEAPRGRGRPRVYSPDEAAKRRREKAKEYSAKRTPEQKAAARERARQWRAANPDKVKEAREKSMKNRAARYAEDPNYRQQFNAYQRDYKRTKRSTTTKGEEG